MESDRLLFGIADYVLFALVLLVSASIGLYYAICAGRQKTSAEFLMADRSMGFFPVSMSLLASLFTGIYIQGVTADVYFRGTMMWWNMVGQIGASWVAARCFLPIYFNLRLTSVYEYLELRFSPAVRTCGLLVCYVYMLLHSGIATFGASMVLIAVSDITLMGSILLLSIVTIFYTAIGGIKAVLWADSFQMFLIFASLVAVIIKGSLAAGGLSNVFAIADQGDRIEFWNFSLDPREYLTVWNAWFGGVIAWLPAQAIMQYQVQRYLTCKDFKTANIAMAIYAGGMIVVTSLCCTAGLAMYAMYAGCDPFALGKLQFRDGLLPYFILEAFYQQPGLPGLLTAGLCSLCLSTVSSVLNALSAVTSQHFISAFWPDLNESTAVLINKSLVIFFGIIVIGTSFMMSKLGDLIPALLGVVGVTNGPILGVFILGIFTTRGNSKGALAGFATSLVFGLWLLIGSLRHPYPLKSLSLRIDECPVGNTTMADDTMTTMITTVIGTTLVSNMTTVVSDVAQRTVLQNIYATSKLTYPIITCTIAVIVGYLVSLATGPNHPGDVDSRLVTYLPDACCFFLPTNWKFWKQEHELHEIPPSKQDMVRGETTIPLKEDYTNNDTKKIQKDNYSKLDEDDTNHDELNHNV